MRHFLSFLFCSATASSVPSDRSGNEIPGENGWSVKCRMNLEEQGLSPAFALVYQDDLYFTSFQTIGNDGVYRVKDYVNNCNDDQKVELLFSNLPWPNSVQPVPSEVFGDNWFTVASGFFPNNKHDGCVIVFNADDPQGTESYLTPGCKHLQGDHDPFFYHKTEWIDMDGDGDLDVVTARCINDGPITPINQTLLWIENNRNKPPTSVSPWKIHEIAALNHADVFFDVGHLPKPSNRLQTQIVIAVGSFYSQKLELIWTEDPKDKWVDGSKQRSVEIDNAGWYFAVEFHDVNNNGKEELMTTTWSRTDENGQAIAYELNAQDWQKPESWLKHVIYNRYPRFVNAGFGSPGGFSMANPDTTAKGKQTIYVSGDDDGKIYRHTPSSELAGNFRYSTDTIYTTDDNLSQITGATIGEITAIDLNGDKKTDILLPNYTLKQIIWLEQTGSKDQQ